ncbi:uncharacterized protein [Clytia hemisphaerica]|uniref:Uncharacterized protein n=1 Tax=Clytia hemisphaerica TaxID=252671 RepID=A0A7M5UBN9_9CNID
MIRGRTISAIEPTSQMVIQQRELGHDLKRSEGKSRSTSNLLCKMNFEEKVVRYRFLQEKEYKLRTQLLQEYGNNSCKHAGDDVTLFCDCGRMITSHSPTHQPINSRRNNGGYNGGYLTPPIGHQLRCRSYSDKFARGHRARPLSADVHLEAPKTVALRKMASNERMDRRRESLKSLDMDFEKAKELMQRVKVSSNNSINDSKDIDSIDGLSIKDGLEEDIDSMNNNCDNVQDSYNGLSMKNDSKPIQNVKDGSLSIDKDENPMSTNKNQEQGAHVVKRRRPEGGVMFAIKRERPLSSFY